ncbi:MAG TPA: GldG family protein [Planctomycetota bacterium]|nr:GldG family protein [Planctomycetota bacterium]HRR83063.1 GldG family protein [Planctomycetota bacterium]HRT95153.1 GldG family protein [Planctomycetota bacterium]
MTEERAVTSDKPKAGGLLITLAGLLVTGIGFGVFATQAKEPLAGKAPALLAFLSLVVGVALVEAGAWLNAAFYRGLEKSPHRAWLEVGGGVALVVGIVVLGNCLAFYWTGTSAVPVAGLVVGLLLLELALAAEHRTIIRVCTGPSFPLTMIVLGAGVLGVLALGLVSYINVRRYRRVDLTRTGFYSLNDQTVKILKSVEKPLRIIATMVRHPNPQGPEEFKNFVRGRVGELLEEYASQSRHVEYIPLNIYADPEAAAKMGAELKTELLADTVVFAYEGKTKVVELSEMLTQSMFGEPPQFKGEEAFTGALQALLEQKTTKVYFVIGHGERGIDDYERDGASTIVERVRGDNCEVKTCELPEIPDDCDVLVIAGPKTPIRPEEVEAVRKYLTGKEGAGLIVMLDPAVGDTAPSGLEVFLRENAIEARTMDAIVDIGRQEILPGIVSTGPTVSIDATEYGGGQAMMMGGGPPHPIVRDLKTLRTTFYLACPLVSTAPPRPSPYGGPPQGDPFTAELVKTSPRAYAKADLDPANLARLRINQDQDKPGPFTLAIARGQTKGQEPPPMRQPMGPPPQGKLVVFGDSDFITNMYVTRGSTGNATLFRNAVAWAAGKEYKIGIPPKPLQQQDILDMPSDEKNFAWWATVFAPPFHILVIGLVVWWIRRR